MKMKRVHLLVLLLLLFQIHTFPSISQSKRQREVATRIAINGALQNIYDGRFEADEVVDIDSVAGDMRFFLEPVEDPYGTLRNSFFFTSRLSNGRSCSGNIVGLFRDNSMIWYSDTVFTEGAGRLYTTRDLLANGNVEIITVWGGGAVEPAFMWIFSWDGLTGRRINALDADGQSVIMGDERGFCLFDAEGDGILEIKDLSVDDGSRTWSWNGQEFGSWPNTPHLSNKVWLPRNKITASVRCVVSGQDTTKTYRYTVSSDHSSKQRVNEFLVQAFTGDLNKESPKAWEPGKHYLFKLNGWRTMVFDHNGLIWPGKALGGFVMKTKALPKIVWYYIQGYNTLPYHDLMTPDEESAGLSRDLVDNSVVGKTVGPADPPSSFVPLNFLDTLSDYTGQSRSLGWITNQAVAEKYLGYFGTAKSQLQSNNTSGARATLQALSQDVNVDSSSTLTSEAYALLRYNTEYLLGQLPAAPPPGLVVKLVNSAGTNLTGGSLQYYDGSWKDAVNNNDGTFNVNTTLAGVSLKMTYAGGSQTKNNVAVGPDIVTFQTVNAAVQLKSSQGSFIDQGTVQYYFSSWQSFGTTTNGVVTKELLPASYTFRMTYATATNDKQQDIGSNGTVVFQTVNAAVQLQNSQGALMDQGTVQYYFSSWQNLGTTSGGVATKELLPANYTFRMTYASATNDKQQTIATNPTVVFATVNATVQLKNSLGDFIDQGTVQYYFSSWQSLGTTTNGVASKELLPGSYTFRMSYASATKDKQQNIGTNPTVIFATVNATVQLKNSQGAFIDQGTVQYYFSSWQSLGSTTNGVVTKELLPGSYTFRMAYETVTNDKVQDISTNNTVSFSTVLCTVSVKNAQSQPVDGALISYYFSSWRQIGTTVGGQVTKELLPASMTFRATLGTATQDKVQNVGTNSLVEINLQ